MKDISCEEVLTAKMAEADGEIAELSSEEIGRHLLACKACNDELAQPEETEHLFRNVKRREQPVDLWPAVSPVLTQPTTTIGWKPFAVAGVLLVAFKLIELLPAKDPGIAVKLLPLIIFGCLILFLRENPFRINTELMMEK